MTIRRPTPTLKSTFGTAHPTNDPTNKDPNGTFGDFNKRLGGKALEC